MKTLRKLQRMAFMSLILLAIVSCEKDDEIVSSQPINETAVSSDSKGMMVLGNQLENPYSVENMQKAYNELVSSDNLKSAEDFKIEATHLYVRFRPQNEEELDRLKADTNIVSYDFPLDYEIEVEGNYYRDPEVSDDQPTYQYAAVKVDQVLPENIDYDVLSELFIVEENDSQLKSGNSSDWRKLENKAFEMTGNLDVNTDSQEGDLKATFYPIRSWIPSGSISFFDYSASKYIPIEGLTVRARVWFTTYTGKTNKYGYYKCNGSFTRAAQYSFAWESEDFSIRTPSGYDSITYIGPYKVGAWHLRTDDYDISTYGSVFKAAYNYYYGDMQGLKRPPMFGDLGSKMKITCGPRIIGDYCGYDPATPDQITVGVITGYKPLAYEIYFEVVRKITQATIHHVRGYLYKYVKEDLKNSWSYGLAEVFSNLLNDQAPLSKQGPGINNLCPTVVKALTRKDVNSYYLSRGYYNSVTGEIVKRNASYRSRANGYTLKELEAAFYRSYSFINWYQQLERMYDKPYEEELRGLFLFWCSQK